jgi:rubrerythrin
MTHRRLGLAISRRQALKYGALVSGVCFSEYFLGGAAPAFGQSPARDLAILNAALYLEHEAIAAYTAGAGSGLLSADVLKVAAGFMSDHQYHRDGIAGVIRTLGETPPEAKPDYRFGPLRNASDILTLALRLEQGAAMAYRTLASSVQSKGALTFAAHVLADEVRHATVLKKALGLRDYWLG